VTAPLRSDQLGLIVTIRPEHRLNRDDLITALAVAKDGCIIGKMMTANPSQAECEAAVRHILWESGNDFRERLAIETDVEERMGWAREMFARHFTGLYAEERR
jgi:hypothetical protein